LLIIIGFFSLEQNPFQKNGLLKGEIC
jgi:hypothetical protein